jgi:hypothetical protein
VQVGAELPLLYPLGRSKQLPEVVYPDIADTAYASMSVAVSSRGRRWSPRQVVGQSFRFLSPIKGTIAERKP